MERRGFVKSSCNICLLLAAGYALPRLASCSPAAFQTMQANIVNNTIQVPLSSFSKTGLQIVRPKGWYFDIAVQKKEDNSYEALLLQCTHQENQLTPTGNGYTCSLHGSQFDRNGKVVKGPAEQPLEQYKISIDNGQLIIHLKA